MSTTIEYQNIHENRNYKDTLFRMVFKKKEDLLDLYNAINGTDYKNPDELEVNTLENVLYMTMKNDISFLIGCSMNLYEHQSSDNKNMPLRGFLYLARLFETYVAENGLDIYSSTLQKLPTPRYIVFYNGNREEPDEHVLRLSDAFYKEGGCLDCEARMLNINYGHNRELMEKCRRLEEYAIFVARVRKKMKEKRNTLKIAITEAIDECTKEGILMDILVRQRNEVLGVLLSTFNKELYEKNLKEDAYSKGRTEGKIEGKIEIQIELIRKKLEKGKSIIEIANDLEELPETIERLLKQIE